MARKKGGAGGKVAIGGQFFVPITFDELESAAYRELTGTAAKLYGYMKKVARTKAHTEGVSSDRDVTFDFTYSEAVRLGFAEKTFSRALRQLWSVGFISVVSRGGLRGTSRTNSRYKLAGEWRSYRKIGGWFDRENYERNPFKDMTEPLRSDVAPW